MDVSIFFSCSGRGKGESEAPGGGGVLQDCRGRGAGRVYAANWGYVYVPFFDLGALKGPELR